MAFNDHRLKSVPLWTRSGKVIGMEAGKYNASSQHGVASGVGYDVIYVTLKRWTCNVVFIQQTLCLTGVVRLLQEKVGHSAMRQAGDHRGWRQHQCELD